MITIRNEKGISVSFSIDNTRILDSLRSKKIFLMHTVQVYNVIFYHVIVQVMTTNTNIDLKLTSLQK